MKPSDRRRAAHHEAGHAVAALLILGAPRPWSVTLRPRRLKLGLAGGLTRFDRRPGKTPRALDAWAVICAAGPVTERRVCDEAADFGDEDELIATFEERSGSEDVFAGTDDEEIEAWIRRSGFRHKVAAWKRRIYGRARHLLARPRARRMINALANVLLERGSLHGSEIVAAAGREPPGTQGARGEGTRGLIAATVQPTPGQSR